MRVHRCIIALTSAATLATSAPAYAFTARAPQGPSVIPSATPVRHQSTDTAEWLIGAGAAGLVALGGALVVRRRSSTSTRPYLGAASARGANRTH